jgi:hypothetical protein
MLLARFIDASRARLGGPVEFHMACSFGRSYVVKTPSWWHRLPAISKSGLCELPDNYEGNTYSILADVGNDIFIGISNEKILSSVRMVLEKMLRNSHKVALTELPVGPAEKISPFAYRFFKTLLFRHSDITLDHLLNLGKELNAGMLELADELGVVPVRFDTDWYRPDAIHIKTRHADQAVAKCLTALGMPDDPVKVTPSRISTSQLKHQLRYRSSKEVWTTQPGHRLVDGSSVSLY